MVPQIPAHVDPPFAKSCIFHPLLHGPSFSKSCIFRRPISRVAWAKLYQILEHRSVMNACNFVLNFRFVAPFENEDDSKRRLMSKKTKANFCTFLPL